MTNSQKKISVVVCSSRLNNIPPLLTLIAPFQAASSPVMNGTRVGAYIGAI